MKYLFQMMIIGGITFLGELLHFLIPLPVPASVYGMLLLFLCLMTGIIKTEAIEEAADFLLVIMPVLFISPSVGLIESYAQVSGSILSVGIIIAISTVVVMIVSGLTAQWMIVRKEKKFKKDN